MAEAMALTGMMKTARVTRVAVTPRAMARYAARWNVWNENSHAYIGTITAVCMQDGGSGGGGAGDDGGSNVDMPSELVVGGGMDAGSGISRIGIGENAPKPPHLLAVPIQRRPLFPGFMAPLVITDEVGTIGTRSCCGVHRAFASHGVLPPFFRRHSFLPWWR